MLLPGQSLLLVRGAEEMNDELDLGEAHPATHTALQYLRGIGAAQLMVYYESFSSCAMAGNRLSEICAGTLKRLLDSKPVSDRYVLGLCWAIHELERNK